LVIVLTYRWPRLWRPVLAALAVGVVVSLVIGPAQVVQALAAAPALGGWSGRLELWSRAMDAIADYPFTGIGMGTFDRVIPLRYPYVLLAGAELAIPHAHNLFLQVAVDLGLPGLAAFVALLGIVLVSAVRAGHQWSVASGQWPVEQDASLLALEVVGLAAGLVAVLIHGLIDAASWGSKPAIIIWGTMGLIMAHRAVSVQQSALSFQPGEESADEQRSSGPEPQMINTRMRR
jgi:putative inorganic carbon (HCO3(-)) transporter